jgi:hypothetical protein
MINYFTLPFIIIIMLFCHEWNLKYTLKNNNESIKLVTLILFHLTQLLCHVISIAYV